MTHDTGFAPYRDTVTGGSTVSFPQPQTLETLATLLAPTLARFSAESPLRVWVPWCRRAEDAWSLAVCLWECFEAIHAEPRIRLFATDRDEDAVAAFRQGLCPPDIAQHVSARRLARFFERHSDGYRVCAALRRTVLVERHDALGDPPIFTGLDLIDCRGLPQDIEAARVSPLCQRLHCALRDGGWLLLGHAVPAKAIESLFESASTDCPVYRKHAAPRSFELGDAEREGSTGARRRRARLEEQLRSANREIASMAAEIDMMYEDRAALNAELERRVRELNSQVKLLQREISDIASAEQQRMGRELHDGIQQELAGLGLLAEALCDTLGGGGAAATADVARRLAQGITAANERLHALARGLVPMPIDPDNLEPALSELARSTRETFHVACRFEPAQAARISDADTATHLYRIAQEAVRNATTHSNADRVGIRLTAPETGLMLEVTDNGIGLAPPGRLRPGVGLRLMEHRCSLLGGRFIAESRAEGGTRIACILPAPIDRSTP